MKRLILLFCIFFCSKKISALEGQCFLVSSKAHIKYKDCWCPCYDYKLTKMGRCQNCAHYSQRRIIGLPPAYARAVVIKTKEYKF